MTFNADRVEELRAVLLDFEESEVLEALIDNCIIDKGSGMLTDYWANLLDPNLTGKKHNRAEEDLILGALAGILKRRLK
jgi:hypothetical protein